jgi:hypothetical protein
MKLNKGKMGFTKENKKKFTKRNKILHLTKQNETKFRSLFCFAKQAKFRETILLFRFVLCFAKQKKRMRNGNPTSVKIENEHLRSNQCCGSGAFLPPGSGSGMNFFWILDPAPAPFLMTFSYNIFRIHVMLSL